MAWKHYYHDYGGFSTTVNNVLYNCNVVGEAYRTGNTSLYIALTFTITRQTSDTVNYQVNLDNKSYTSYGPRSGSGTVTYTLSETVQISKNADSYTPHWIVYINGIVVQENGWIIDYEAVPTYSITYNANGGYNAPASQTKYYNESISLSSSTPTRSGYRFTG